MSEFNDLMKSITNVYLAGMGLPPLKASGQARDSETITEDSLALTDARPVGPEVGSPLYERLRKPDQHDFRDYPQRDRPDWDMDARGNPLRPGT